MRTGAIVRKGASRAIRWFQWSRSPHASSELPVQMAAIGRSAALLLALFAVEAAPVRAQAPEATVVYLVRHAEKAADHPDDPTLTPEGLERARLLTRVLGEAGITQILSTSFRRTRLTVAPLAEKLGLEVAEYSTDDMQAVANRILTTPGRYLISGHSGSTPAMVGLLGGEPGPPIDDLTEYDRIYVVVIGADGSVTTSQLRYGAASM